MTTPKLRIIVTNDDGRHSPLLPALLNAIQSAEFCASVQFVVPAEERSWVSGAMTRFHRVRCEQQRIEEHDGFVVSGTPADCANLAAHSLFSKRPDLVISGINIGNNAGLPFFLSSGTIAGAAFAKLAGCRAIALSARFPSDLFHAWSCRDWKLLRSQQNHWTLLAGAAISVIKRLLNEKLWAGVDLYSANFPWEITHETPMRMTTLDRPEFGSLFRETAPGEYLHRCEGFEDPSASLDPTTGLPWDRRVLYDNEISICPIQFTLSPRNIDELATAFDNAGTLNG